MEMQFYFFIFANMTGVIDQADVTALIGQYNDVYQIIFGSLLILAGLFIVKGGFQWLLGMFEKAMSFGGKK